MKLLNEIWKRKLQILDGNKYYDQKTVITTKNGKVCCDQNDDYIIFNTEKSGLCDCTYGYGCKLM